MVVVSREWACTAENGAMHPIRVFQAILGGIAVFLLTLALTSGVDAKRGYTVSRNVSRNHTAAEKGALNSTGSIALLGFFVVTGVLGLTLFIKTER